MRDDSSKKHSLSTALQGASSKLASTALQGACANKIKLNIYRPATCASHGAAQAVSNGCNLQGFFATFFVFPKDNAVFGASE